MFGVLLPCVCDATTTTRFAFVCHLLIGTDAELLSLFASKVTIARHISDLRRGLAKRPQGLYVALYSAVPIDLAVGSVCVTLTRSSHDISMCCDSLTNISGQLNIVFLVIFSLTFHQHRSRLTPPAMIIAAPYTAAYVCNNKTPNDFSSVKAR